MPSIAISLCQAKESKSVCCCKLTSVHTTHTHRHIYGHAKLQQTNQIFIFVFLNVRKLNDKINSEDLDLI